MNPLRVLLVMEQCNPEWTSVPLLAFHTYDAVSRLADTTLVTHERNRDALEKVRDGREIVYMEEPGWVKAYYRLLGPLTSRGGTNWPLLHALSYPVYAAFDRAVRKRFLPQLCNGRYDVVHAMTPILPRYPVGIGRLAPVPFVLGPVNGGLPFPRQFADVARREFAAFNFLRSMTRLIPGYAATYAKADLILSGSEYTLQMLTRRFPESAAKLRLFHENGLRPDFIADAPPQQKQEGPLRLLFVGRLVPYKGADMVLEAMAKCKEPDLHLTIAGDGPQRTELKELAARLGLSDRIIFTGWVEHTTTAKLYRESHAFVFPSVREFGGAVVLEAMAAGLPCVVAAYGGIGEYVTEECGIRLPIKPREEMIDDLAQAIRSLAADETARQNMAKAALQRAQASSWPEKARRILEFYQEARERRDSS